MRYQRGKVNGDRCYSMNLRRYVIQTDSTGHSARLKTQPRAHGPKGSNFLIASVLKQQLL